jgi:hypothetical protein
MKIIKGILWRSELAEAVPSSVMMVESNRNGVNGKMRGVWTNGFLTKESAIEKTNHSENLP